LSRPTRADIAEEDVDMLRRQSSFRRAADAVVAAFTAFSEVQAIALFGSAAQPLPREVPRFRHYRRYGIETLHECKDVDLAAWVDRLDCLSELNRARSRAVTRLFADENIGVAHHQVDIFLFEPCGRRYLGRLCAFAQCPKDKVDCLTPGCGRVPLLKQHEDFVLDPEALSDHRAMALFDRAQGLLRRASDLPDTVPIPWARTPHQPPGS
jgi:hypothetical protein